MMLRAFLFLSVVLSLAVSDLQAQWENIAPRLLGDRVFASGEAMAHLGRQIWAGNKQLFISSDLGETWIDRTPMSHDSEYVFDIQLLDTNTAVVVTSVNYYYSWPYGFKNEGRVYLTEDQGITWKLLLEDTATVYSSATFAGTANDIIVAKNYAQLWTTHDQGTSWLVSNFLPAGAMDGAIHHLQRGWNGDIYALFNLSWDRSHLLVSTDKGDTWEARPGTYDYDCFSMAIDSCDRAIYIVNEEHYVDGSETDGFAEIYRTGDEGITIEPMFAEWLQVGFGWHFNGSIEATPRAVYTQSGRDGILRSTDKGRTWLQLGGPDGRVDARTIVVIEDSIILAQSGDGSIWRTMNAGGLMLPPLPQLPRLRTEDVIVDTLGEEVRLPIYVDGEPMTDVAFTIRFNSRMDYDSTATIDGERVDVTINECCGSVRIVIPLEQVRRDGPSAYIYFNNILSDIEERFTVSFDSLALGQVDCGMQMVQETVTGTITVPAGCGLITLSRALRNTRAPKIFVPRFSIDRREIHITANTEYESATVRMVDMMGATRFERRIYGDSPINTIDYSSLPSGAYFLMIKGPRGEETTPFSIVD
jgi:photosystem II stability/assembly factor-like uncharacterized protein